MTGKSPAPVSLPDTMIEVLHEDDRDSDPQCLEKRVYYKVISGTFMHFQPPASAELQLKACMLQYQHIYVKNGLIKPLDNGCVQGKKSSYTYLIGLFRNQT